MDFDNIRGVIELGNINLKCVIFEISDNNELKILSNSIMKTDGIHNGVVVNINRASKAIRSCISDAEKKINISLKKINVVLEQPEFLCTKFSKVRKINGSKIYKEDIDFLLKEAKKEVTLNDEKQDIIHIFNHNYIVDGKTFVEEPINVYADSLTHEMTFVTMPKNNAKNINQTFFDCDIEVERFFSSTFSLAARLLNRNELQHGSMLIDFGHEKTSLGLFKNLALVHSLTFPIGTNHITKDISKVCKLNLVEAENIKNKINLSFENKQELFDEKNYLKEIYFRDSSFRKVSKLLILNIVKARLDEIFQIVKKQILETDHNATFERNLYIVGEGSELINLEEYCSNYFGFHVNKFDKNKKKEESSILGACLGAAKIIKDGWETEAIPEPASKYSKKSSFFAKIFGKAT